MLVTINHYIKPRCHLAGTGDEPHHELQGEPAHVDALYHGEYLVPLVDVLQPTMKLYSYRKSIDIYPLILVRKRALN